MDTFTYPGRLACLVEAGILPDDAAVTYAVERGEDVDVLHLFAGHQSRLEQRLGSAGQLVADLTDPDRPVRMRECICAEWSGGINAGWEADADAGVVLSVLWWAERAVGSGRNTARLASLRGVVVDTPAETGRPGLDRLVARLAAQVRAEVDAMRSEDWFLNEFACTLLRGVRRWHNSTPAELAGYGLVELGAAPEVPVWETDEDRSTDPAATIAALAAPRVWVAAIGNQPRLGAFTTDLHPGGCGRVPAAVVIDRWTGSLDVLGLDRGYAAAEVAAAAAIRAADIPVGDLIDAVRATV